MTTAYRPYSRTSTPARFYTSPSGRCCGRKTSATVSWGCCGRIPKTTPQISRGISYDTSSPLPTEEIHEQALEARSGQALRPESGQAFRGQASLFGSRGSPDTRAAWTRAARAASRPGGHPRFSGRAVYHPRPLRIQDALQPGCADGRPRGTHSRRYSRGGGSQASLAALLREFPPLPRDPDWPLALRRAHKLVRHYG